MSRVGRGRSRGGRVLDTADLIKGMGHGKMIGRGISVEMSDSYVRSLNNHVVEKVESFEDRLTQLAHTKTGSFIHITLDYFSTSSDVQHYIDNVMESVLKSSSSFMAEQFAASFMLVTLLKTHGDEIKEKMLKKLQTSYLDTQVLMLDCSLISEEEKCRVRNYCELLGQLYFRFRLKLGHFERYNVLAIAALDCMMHLLKLKTEKELAILVKLVVLNYSSLCELTEDSIREKRQQLDVTLRTAISNEDAREVRKWLLCVLDCMGHNGKLPTELTKFYSELLGSHAIHKVPEHMLAEVPTHLAQSHANMFTISLDEYKKNRITPTGEVLVQ